MSVFGYLLIFYRVTKRVIFFVFMVGMTFICICLFLQNLIVGAEERTWTRPRFDNWRFGMVILGAFALRELVVCSAGQFPSALPMLVTFVQATLTDDGTTIGARVIIRRSLRSLKHVLRYVLTQVDGFTTVRAL